MTEQRSDRSVMLNHKTLPTSGPLSYLHGSAWRPEPHTEREKAPLVWTRSNCAVKTAFDIQIVRKLGPGRPKMTRNQLTERDCREWKPSAIDPHMIETSGDLVWDLPCVQQATYLEGGPLLLILPLYLHINKKSNDDDDEEENYSSGAISPLSHDIAIYFFN